MPGETEKIRPHSALADNGKIIPIQVIEAAGASLAVDDIRNKLKIACLGSWVGNTINPVPNVE